MTQEQFSRRCRYDKVTDRLGGGGFGTVYKVFDTVENQHYALKIAEVKHGFENLSLLKEVELSRSLVGHENIVRYINCYRFDLLRVISILASCNTTPWQSVATDQKQEAE